MIRVDRAMVRDVGRIYETEYKSQEFAFTTDEIQKYMLTPGKVAWVASIGDRTCGSLLASECLEDNAVVVDHVSVIPRFRALKVSMKMLDKASDHALATLKSGLACLRINVPSYLVEDKEDPWNIESWLWKAQFKAMDLISNEIKRYNQNYDCYVFERSL